MNDIKNLKGRIRVQFLSETGTEEAGIDGGGLFKDFIDSFMKTAFSPSYGLFIPTSEQLLVPNPASSLVNDNHLDIYKLFGLVLGKAIYEGILSEPQFSTIFLNILLGRFNQLDDLIYLDEQLYRSLINLKTFAQTEDVSSLGLMFEIERIQYGQKVVEELKPNGSNTLVTNSNLNYYIHKYAYFKLNVEILEQSKAFLSGFREIIPSQYIQIFTPKELQLIISGNNNNLIDFKNFKENVHYSGGYAASQPYIISFWDIVENEFTIDEQCEFLKFVTSCSRPPLLGFQALSPKFCINQVSTYGDDTIAARLPTAATCMNLLKLPKYSSINELKEKLLYAIKSNSGFELS
eukprot:gene18995-24813_t